MRVCVKLRGVERQQTEITARRLLFRLVWLISLLTRQFHVKCQAYNVTKFPVLPIEVAKTFMMVFSRSSEDRS